MGEAIAFYVLAATIVLAALGVVTLRNLFRCALCLGLVLFCVAGLFILNGAEFLAGVQVLIYVGAVLVIILFAVMLSENITGERIKLVSYNRTLGLLAALGFLGVVLFLAVTQTHQHHQRPGAGFGGEGADQHRCFRHFAADQIHRPV